MTENSSTRQIVAIGGAGLSTESGNFLLEQYLLKLDQIQPIDQNLQDKRSQLLG